jgi:hypothetical protein
MKGNAAATPFAILYSDFQLLCLQSSDDVQVSFFNFEPVPDVWQDHRRVLD